MQMNWTVKATSEGRGVNSGRPSANHRGADVLSAVVHSPRQVRI